jgi:predicted DNA-binding transcriptional regulator AlpA
LNPQIATPERLLDSHTVAKRLGVTERSIRAWASNGEFGPGAFKVGKKLWRFVESSIETISRNAASSILPA